ncbi:MAG: hypothetical protein AAFX06_32760 [Planctomycetota bacterium]
MPKLRELYQGHGLLPNSQGVPEGPERKHHVGRLREMFAFRYWVTGSWIREL